MLAEINRLDAAIEQAQSETRKTAEDLESERRAHDQTKAEVREAKAIAGEREKRIDDQGRELAEVRRQASEASSKHELVVRELDQTKRDLADASEAGERSEVDLQRARAEFAELQEQRNLVAAELKEAQAANERLAGNLDREKETAKQAKVALDAGGKKIEALERALEEERHMLREAERTAADLRMEVATLTERAAHVDELRQLLHQVQPTAVKQEAQE